MQKQFEGANLGVKCFIGNAARGSAQTSMAVLYFNQKP